MNAVADASKAVLALFVDDSKLAVQIVVLLVCTAFVANAESAPPSVSIELIVGGALILLLENVVRASRERQR